MSAAKYDIEIQRYADFVLPLQILTGSGENAVATDLTDKELRMQIRRTVEEREYLTELNTDNGGINLVAATEGRIELVIGEEETRNFNWQEGVYDLLLITPGERTRRILQGKASVSAGVTR
ncbi:MAG: hypothetical protein WEB57_08095 [Pseudohongiellaceae bacterium]